MAGSENQESGEGKRCRICGDVVEEFIDFGRQPVSDSFVMPYEAGQEFFFRLSAGICVACSMVQLTEEVPREQMFHEDYPYRSSGSTRMRSHFHSVAQRLLETELTGRDPLIVEIGSNDGIMLRTVRDAGVRHLGVDPSVRAAELAASEGIRVQTDFFEEQSARKIAASEGPANVIFSANTFSHIAYIDSIFRGVDTLLASDGVFVFEDRYLGDIISRNAFDQIYDEHFYLFSVSSVQSIAQTFGFVLIDAEHLDIHGGSMRYTVARPGVRIPSDSVAQFLRQEQKMGLADPGTYRRFAEETRNSCSELISLLRDLRAEGKTVVGYGATAKSSTLLNYCNIGSDLVSCIFDSTPEKQGRLSPGTHIPVRSSDEFSAPYPDYALLFAWNHSDEILAKEQEFREAGGRWILYVPTVHLI
ncbi:class I SAM-dependent methyltransferase [Lipingzhangella sp. LS1_29]|uniref:Class I SAM-dependent methyltransferase n=1 Tax=Lipingzhangella rawalii TaxID=2055835 RepID=A0ABU2H7H0_9ACTN|nr:class I SAM-dependent methyltransferase [Lipingzhangella rawalii]MDS1270795.1 class I SAM-dependent methyltransferase [Lipingzhangella rawalii]